MRQIKNIIFDFGGVIVDLNLEATIEAFARQGVDARRFVDLSAQKGLFADLERGYLNGKEFCQRLRLATREYRLKDASIGTLDDRTIQEAWCQMLVGIPLHRLEALKTLSKRYRLALLSNTNDIHWEYSLRHHFRAQGVESGDLFQHIFLSYEMHQAKPDAGIFQSVLRESGFDPEETLFIDDSPVNCQAFAALGVRTFCPAKPDDWVPKVATIGFFDGVHRGHQCLIDQVATIAKERGLASALFTFDQHPRKILNEDYIPRLLTTLDEKRALLSGTCANLSYVLPFSRETAALSARDFMQQILRDRYQVRVLVMGYDHRFGHGGGCFDDYVRWGKEVGIEVIQAHELKSCKVSSSLIRHSIEKGNVREAAIMLGHTYTLCGTVGEGHRIGRELGFPTANLCVEPDKLLPGCGVYAVWVTLPDGSRRMGMLNIGNRPTLNNGTDISVEVNLLNFEGNLYGQKLKLEIVYFLRYEKRFSDNLNLRLQLEKDAYNVEQLLHEE